MTINATAAILLALYVAVADARGVPRARLGGTIQNDILKEYIARGTYIYPTAAVDAPRDRRLRVLRHASCRAGTRSRISGYHMREAGATAAQELAFTLADAIAYVEAARARGLDVDDFARPPVVLLRRLERALRGGRQVPGRPADVGAHHARPLRGSRTPRSMMCRFHVQTAGSSLTAQSIDNNVVRTTIQALAAVLGRHPEPAHQRARRGAGPADRGGGPAGAADPADPGLRDRRDRDAGPARRLLLRGVADRPARGRRAGLPRRDRRDGRRRSRPSRRGFQQRQIQEAGLPRRSGRSRTGTRSWSGVNRYRGRRGRRRRRLQRIDPTAERRAGRGRPRASAPNATPTPGQRAMAALDADGARHGQPAAAIIDGRQGARDGGRDQRSAAGRLGRAPRADHGLRDEMERRRSIAEPLGRRPPRRGGRGATSTRALRFWRDTARAASSRRSCRSRRTG